MEELGARIWDTTWRYRDDALSPSREDVDLIAEILGGRHLPQRDVVALARDHEEHATRLSLEQASLLNVTRLLHRVEIRGGAGSGKTVMAIQQARDLANGRLREGKRQRIAVVCYSYGLANHLRRELLVGSRGKQPAFVGTFEQLGNQWGIASETRNDSDFWENRLPARMAEQAEALDDSRRFDAIIVDEAQDFAESWWIPLVASLKDPESGGLFVYADERQRVFPRFGGYS